ncbi:hypothetical protein L226DRAFT_197969 [Lentinus tigrinus ALCF2SS1-7]|uniref:uncharacterized protein n=1 Tax=Lentinus tigrinus ALCF2SS1-7 TaxID=1328758 RepID=UPI001165FDEB|nr:hypothetical protein L226DRAFT_197969 [Lentinus tigrinus ALCF2SS1-7]
MARPPPGSLLPPAIAQLSGHRTPSATPRGKHGEQDREEGRTIRSHLLDRNGGDQTLRHCAWSVVRSCLVFRRPSGNRQASLRHVTPDRKH